MSATLSESLTVIGKGDQRHEQNLRCDASGIRMGLEEAERADLQVALVEWIDEVLTSPDDAGVHQRVRGAVNAFMAKFPLYTRATHTAH